MLFKDKQFKNHRSLTLVAHVVQACRGYVRFYYYQEDCVAHLLVLLTLPVKVYASKGGERENTQIRAGGIDCSQHLSCGWRREMFGSYLLSAQQIARHPYV